MDFYLPAIGYHTDLTKGARWLQVDYRPSSQLHQLTANEALPSIRGLAAEIGVSVITTKRAYEELEKEGLIRSVANKGFYVCEYNTDYLHEKQLMLLEKHFADAISLARQAGLSDAEIRDMLEGLM